MAHLQAGRWQEAIQAFEALLQDYPEDATVKRALEDARFRAQQDQRARVRPRRTAIAWRPIIVRLLLVAVVGAFAYMGYQFLDKQIAPTLAQAQIDRQRNQLERECAAFFEGGDLDKAQDRCTALLVEEPDNATAERVLAQIAAQRELEEIYVQAVALQEAGEHASALELFTEISVRQPRFRDVSLRISAIRRQQELDRLFAEAEADYHAGMYSEALLKYEQLRELNVSYRADYIEGRVFELYMRMGRELIAREPQSPDNVPGAYDLFTSALVLQPRNAEAAEEQRLAGLYLEGRRKYYEGYYDAAIAPLRAVYDQRPYYIATTLSDMLYDAYVRSGDQHQEAGDLYYAYEQYRRAYELPVPDKSLAEGRMFAVRPFLTPTATPTVTPTPTSTPLPTPLPWPTGVPTPPPLRTLRNQIVFYSGDEYQSGYWVMNPDGTNRRYLGRSRALQTEFEELVESERYSPDGRYYLFVRDAGSPQIFMQLPKHEVYGEVPPTQISRLGGTCYDPVWSPDGGTIAFVSNETGSDDIWLVQPDGSGQRNLTENHWEWDKHPSWSPDSTRIVFWSNRNGIKQIWVMDADGRNAHNISNTEWEEYDPIWVK